MSRLTSICNTSLFLFFFVMWISATAISAFRVSRVGSVVAPRLPRQLPPLKSSCGPFRTLHSSASNEDHNVIDPDHRKSYHIRGTSTFPTSFSSSETTTGEEGRSRPPPPPPRRRRRGSGPAVTLHTVNTNHTLQTDVPKTMGGTNLAPQPVETLLAALIGCTQATALFVGRQLGGITIDKMEFDITAARDERGALQLPIEVTPDIPSRLQEINGIVKVYTPESLSQETLELLREQTEARCPVANMVLASGCQMNVEWISIVTKEEE